MKMQKENKKADKTILAITDFSKSSTHAILSAARLFENANLKYKLLNVFENPGEKAALLISIEDILAKDSEMGLKKQAAEIAPALNSPESNISTYSIAGKLRKAVSDIVRSESVDLIVTGIPADKYPCKTPDNKPILFMGQSRVPVLMVPEKCSDETVKSVLILNLYAQLPEKVIAKGFESIVNHDHIAKNVIYINEKKISTALSASLHDALSKSEANLIIIIPAPGDKIDRALLDFHIQELCPTVAALLNS